VERIRRLSAQDGHPRNNELAIGEHLEISVSGSSSAESGGYAVLWLVNGIYAAYESWMFAGSLSETGSIVVVNENFFVSLVGQRGEEEAMSVEVTVTITITCTGSTPEGPPDTSQIEDQVENFVRSRQGHIAASARTPTLEERRRRTSGDPVLLEFMPGNGNIAARAAASLARLDADYSAPFNLWFDGTLSLHNRPQNDSHWGRFGILNFGADYLVTDNLMVGLSLHIDEMTDPSNSGLVSGTGWMIGPYVSAEVIPGVFWDASVLYGRSGNTVESLGWTGAFDTTRKLFDTTVRGSVSLDETTTLTPSFTVFYISEDVGAYTLDDGMGGTVAVAGYTEDQLPASLGLELSRTIVLDSGLTLTPTLGLSGGYAALGGPGAYGSVSAGLVLATEAGIEVSTGLSSAIDAQGGKSISASAGINGSF
jgi:hypothetical protein